MRWVAAKASDILLDPSEGCDLVSQAIVARRTATLRGQERVGEETQKSESVRNRHKDDALGRQERRVRDWTVICASNVGASMEKDHHRLRLAMGWLRRDVYVEH